MDRSSLSHALDDLVLKGGKVFSLMADEGLGAQFAQVDKAARCWLALLPDENGEPPDEIWKAIHAPVLRILNDRRVRQFSTDSHIADMITSTVLDAIQEGQ